MDRQNPSLGKTYIYITFLLFPSGAVFSQQDIFNIPDLKITEKDRMFWQEQVIFYRDKTQFDTTVMYGLGKQEEIGVYAGNYFLNSPGTNSQNRNPFQDEAVAAPNLLLVYQKRFDYSEDLQFSIGTKSGVSLGPNPMLSEFATFNFAMSSYSYQPLGLKFFLGTYAGNSAFFGKYKRGLLSDGDNRLDEYGMMYGFSLEILPGRLDLQCDRISGVNSLGVSVCGLSFPLNENHSLSVGYQIPNPGGSNFNPHAFLIEWNGYF